MADNRKIVIDIEAKDHSSSVFRSATSAIRNFSVNTNNGIIRANNALRSYNNAMRGFNSTIQRSLADAGRAVYSFTTDAIRQFAELERQHARTMGAMASDYDFNFNGNNTVAQKANMDRFYSDSDKLKRQAITLGTAGPNGNGSLFNPIQVSQAQTALTKAGIKPEDIYGTDAIENIIKFAGGNELGIDAATEFAVQLGTQFRIDPSGWGDMLDQVTYAANKSIIDVEDIIESMKYAGNMASGYDQPLSDILAALAVMGNSGLKGSQAGTGVQAIFTRGMSPTGISMAGAPPTDNVEEIYNGFKDRVVDKNGMFKGLGNFTEELASIMNGLTDEELSWFNKKLFGMFQQKAALALGRTGEDGKAVFDDMADAINQNSTGTNDVIYELALAASSGQIDALGNAWTGFKIDIGDSLSPITKEVSMQLRRALTTGDFTFDFDEVRKALQESADDIDDKYGKKIGEATKDVGNFILDLLQIGEAELPIAGGTGEGILKLMNGDFSGAWDSFTQGIEDVNENIDDLPPELQDAAKGFRNLILLLETIFALNMATKIAEFISSIGTLLTGSRIISVKTNVASTNTTVATPNTIVNANSVMVNGGAVTSATFGQVANATVASMMANTTTMTVYANIVNVIGNGGGTGTGSGGGLPTGGGTPLLPSGAGTALIGAGAGAAGAAALGSGAAGGSQLLLPGAVGAAGFGAAVGKTITLYKNPLTGAFMTKGQLAKALGMTALKSAPAIASLAALMTVPSSQSQPIEAYKSGLGNFRDMISDPDRITSFGEFVSEIFRPAGGTTYKENKKMEEIKSATPSAYREQLSTLLDSLGKYTTGKSYIEGMMDRWMYDNKDASQDDYMIIASRLVSTMADYIKSNNINDLSVYANSVPGADTNMYSDILNGSIERFNTSSISLSEAVSRLVENPDFRSGIGSGTMSAEGAYSYIMGQLGASGLSANQQLLESINEGILALDPSLKVDITNPSPVVNVNVDVKVDKQGNISKKVIRDYRGVDNWVFNQSQRYSGSVRTER